jgi:hypothetical protein
VYDERLPAYPNSVKVGSKDCNKALPLGYIFVKLPEKLEVSPP